MQAAADTKTDVRRSAENVVVDEKKRATQRDICEYRMSARYLLGVGVEGSEREED